MDINIPGCAGCNTTAGPGSCAVHGQKAWTDIEKMAPPPTPVILSQIHVVCQQEIDRLRAEWNRLNGIICQNNEIHDRQMAELASRSTSDCPTCHEPIYNVKGAIADMEKLRRENAALREALKSIRDMVNKQAEDEGLWRFAHQVSQGYIQQELRALHAEIERHTT